MSLAVLTVVMGLAWVALCAGLWRLATRVEQMDRLTESLESQRLSTRGPGRG